MRKGEVGRDPSITRFIGRVYKVLFLVAKSSIATRLSRRVSEESLCIVVFEGGRIREVRE